MYTVRANKKKYLQTEKSHNNLKPRNCLCCWHAFVTSLDLYRYYCCWSVCFNNKKKHTSQRTNFEISLAQASHCIIHQLHLESTCVCIFLFIRVRVSVCVRLCFFSPFCQRVFENVVRIAFGYCFKLKVSLERAKVR